MSSYGGYSMSRSQSFDDERVNYNHIAPLKQQLADAGSAPRPPAKIWPNGHANADRYVHPDWQPHTVGICSDRGMVNVLDIPRFALEGHKSGLANTFKGGSQGWMHVGAGPGAKPEVGGRIAGSPDGHTYCCPPDTTWVATKHEFNDNRTGLSENFGALRKIHCCSGRSLPVNRQDAWSRYVNGCYGGHMGSAYGKGQEFLQYAEQHPNQQYELDAAMNAAADDSAFGDVTLYAADLAGIDEGAAAADADADAAFADGTGEDTLAEAPASVELEAAPAAAHLL